jgi:uncharacterized C2H2 Zn-finger protein
MIKVYQYTNNVWKFIRYQCPHCEKNYVGSEVATKHIEKCRINTLKKKQKEYLKEAKHMPIQRIVKGGEVFYRWGDSGKLYKDRKDAEEQARAAYASGYKENELAASKMDGIQIRNIDTIQKYRGGNKT